MKNDKSEENIQRENDYIRGLKIALMQAQELAHYWEKLYRLEKEL